VAELHFTDHAQRQMRRRGIPEAAVYHAVEYADDVLERDDGCTEYVGEWEGLPLLVVLCGDQEPYRVRTVLEWRRRR
jgi:hypothetical protein